jgi:hypothetical protein
LSSIPHPLLGLLQERLIVAARTEVLTAVDGRDEALKEFAAPGCIDI